MESNRDCATMSAVYEITCNQCKEPVNLDVEVDQRSRDPGNQNRHNYIGMTRTSVHCWMNGHLEGQKSKSSKNPLYRHDVEVNGAIPQTYTTRILNRQKNLLPLTVMEALFIERQVQGTSFNGKNEYGRGALI